MATAAAGLAPAKEVVEKKVIMILPKLPTVLLMMLKRRTIDSGPRIGSASCWLLQVGLVRGCLDVASCSGVLF
uniref:Uncharacterized protein n=1 Tax=Zea mays TaxID=4577 RepID=B6UBG3_MAIZE|nr:hypothetical protein [Zea mays]